MDLDIVMTIYDNRYKKVFDVSNVVSDINVYTFLSDQPGKCTFTIQRTDDLAFWEGATVSLICNGINVFKGFVFKKNRGMDVATIDVTAYDQLRYLKNKDSRVFQGMTSSQIFSSICQDFVLKYRVVDASTHICTPRSNDNTTLYEMIQTALDDTLIYAKKWFIIRDNFGTLEHVNIFSLNSGLILGDKSGITDLDYESSIDDDVYNQIKLYRDNKKTKKREIYIVNDTAGIYPAPDYGLGNVDLNNRPIIKNSDGSVSTVYSYTFYPDEVGEKYYVLVPGVRFGLNRKMTNDEAFDWYKKTGEYLGKFNSEDAADEYAESLHDSQARIYENGVNNLIVKTKGDHLKRWGILQLYEKVDESLNIAQIESKARGMLNLYNDTARTLKFDCLGDFRVFAGSIIKVEIADLGDLTLNDYLLVTSCTHKLKNKEHYMSIEVELVRNG